MDKYDIHDIIRYLSKKRDYTVNGLKKKFQNKQFERVEFYNK